MNRLNLLGATLLSVCLTAGLAPTASAQQKPAATFSNPLRDNGPDPWVTQHGGYYYYTNTTGRNITLWKSKALCTPLSSLLFQSVMFLPVVLV